MQLRFYVCFKTVRGDYGSLMPLSALLRADADFVCLFLGDSLALAARPARRASLAEPPGGRLPTVSVGWHMLAANIIWGSTQC